MARFLLISPMASTCLSLKSFDMDCVAGHPRAWSCRPAHGRSISFGLSRVPVISDLLPSPLGRMQAFCRALNLIWTTWQGPPRRVPAAQPVGVGGSGCVRADRGGRIHGRRHAPHHLPRRHHDGGANPETQTCTCCEHREVGSCGLLFRNNPRVTVMTALLQSHLCCLPLLWPQRRGCPVKMSLLLLQGQSASRLELALAVMPSPCL